jgi:CTP:phosphocholine cytidylyltransferase-like protein/thiamine kinase-like enzyme
MDEHTVGSIPSMINTVIIPTAGTGSRMGKYTENLNKSLLSFKGKPIIGHIIDQFPKDTRFIIPVGYLAKQVKDFCSLAYADRQIEFVDIADYTSSSSGTATTVKQCRELIIGPFWYIPCDTYFNENVISQVSANDCYFVKQVAANQNYLYTTFDVDNFAIKHISFKVPQTDEWLAFTGVSYIYDWQDFFVRLDNIPGVEIIETIRISDAVYKLDTWLDFGNPEIYKLELIKSQKFDFTKTDELTYICNNRVIKWWLDSSISKKKYNRTLVNPNVIPANCQYNGNFIAYDYFEGKTLYENNDPLVFASYLNWLKNEVWTPANVDIADASTEFYKIKTLARVNKFLEKYPNLKPVSSIDGVRVKTYEYYLNQIDWNYLSQTTLPGFIHGDLHFDNTVISNTSEFKIIDWRHEFASIVEYGDIYYDLAKLAGGFVINYAEIKDNNFTIEIKEDNVRLTVPNINNIAHYQQQLKEFILTEGYDYKKVQLLIPIIFWNMSPLHSEPFDLFLWYLGIKLFQEIKNEEIY